MAQETGLYIILSFALIGLYLTLVLFLKNPNPLMVVMSGSMEPTLRKGDLIVVSGKHRLKPNVGDIIVYKSRGDREVIHRVIDLTQVGQRIQVTTRGDAQRYSDVELVECEDILGEMVFRLPLLGYPYYIIKR